MFQHFSSAKASTAAFTVSMAPSAFVIDCIMFCVCFGFPQPSEAFMLALAILGCLRAISGSFGWPNLLYPQVLNQL